MPRGKNIDLDTLSPEERERVLRDRASSKARYHRNRQRRNETSRAWHAANKDRMREAGKVWGAANKDRKAANTRRWQQKAVAEMADSYVRANCAQKCPGLSAKDIPPELTAVARVSMLINRTLRANRP